MEEDDSYGEEGDDDEDIDVQNYKGIYFNDEPGSKFHCPDTGAHFVFKDMCSRLDKLKTLIE